MVGSPQHLHKRTQRFFVHQVCSPYFLPLQRPDSVHAERSGAGWSREAHQYPTIPPRVDYELTDLNGLEAPLRSRPTSHDHDGYEHTSSHTLFAAPCMPPVHSSFNPLKAGPWLRMRWPCGVRTGTTNTEPMQRTYQPGGNPQQIAGHRGSGSIHPQASAISSASSGRDLSLCNTTPRTSDALRFKASRSARIPIVLACRFCAGDSRKLKTRKPQRLLVECQGAGTTRSCAERCNDSVGE